MEKVYVCYNIDLGDIMFITTSLENAQELLCDAFIDDWYYEFLGYINQEGQDIQDAFEDSKAVILDWYNDYIILKEAIIE